LCRFQASQPLPTLPLGHAEGRLWPADPGAYGGRKARRPGAYEVLIPDDIFDVAVAQTLTGKSHVAIGRALQQLEDAGILSRLNERKWGRVWECEQFLSLVDSFEKSVRTPGR
jgi:hypothetical protein